jgi:UDP-glucose 4-epimerase
MSCPFTNAVNSLLFFVGGTLGALSTAKIINRKLLSNSGGNVTEFSCTGNPQVLVAGGAGYIASHTIVCLIAEGYDVTIVDNYVNSNAESINRVRQITGCERSRIRVYECDMCDPKALENVFRTSQQFFAVIQFAGLKAVGESVAKPLLYYENNLISTFNLLRMMEKYNVPNIVFSSSATVYGDAVVPITESSPTGNGITNPYGRTKYMIEEILKDWYKAQNASKSIVTLRYFNPVGSHPSGKIGEDPSGIPNNLMPFVSQVAVGRRPHVNVFGNDYPTPDGTGVRDYIHVMDLAEGHVAALKFIEKQWIQTKQESGQYSVFNLGTGSGVSVLEMIKAMEAASGKTLKTVMAPRREGDIATCYADPSKAKNELGWTASRNLQQMCTDLWKWQSDNPQGYTSA